MNGGIRVVVVGREPGLVQHWAEALSADGCLVDARAGGFGLARRLCRQSDAEVAVLDGALPREPEKLKRLRQSVAVICLGPNAHQRCQADAMLPAPVAPEMLRAVVRLIAGNRRRLAELALRAAALRREIDQHKSMERAKGRLMVAFGFSPAQAEQRLLGMAQRLEISPARAAELILGQ